MLRRVLASLLCVLGAVAIGLGVASATVWRPADSVVAEAEGGPGTTLVVTEPGVLDLVADEVTVRARAPRGEGVVIALGRSVDVDAWVGSDRHTRVTGLADWDRLATQVESLPGPEDEAPGDQADGETEGEADGETEGETDGETEGETEGDQADGEAEGDQAEGETEGDQAEGETEGDDATPAPDPAGSDLWLDEATGETEATLAWTREDGRWSVLVAATGEDAGPPTVTLVWPQDVRTPWLVPGVVVGSALLLAGAAWWLVLLLGARRERTAAAAPPPVAETGAPLTRRQLREMEERRSRRRPEPEDVRSRFPMVLTGPRRDSGTPAAPEPQDSVEERPAAPEPQDSVEERPAAPEPQDSVEERPAAPAHEGRRARRAQRGATAPSPAGAADVAPHPRRRHDAEREPSAREDDGRTAGPEPDGEAAASRGPLARWLRRRPAPPPTEPPPPEPPTVEPERDSPRPGPTASADAWRRAWGFTAPGADAVDQPQRTEGPEADPAAGTDDRGGER